MPLFVLSPASLVHSAAFAGFYTYLSLNVVAARKKYGETKPGIPENNETVKNIIRVQSNFAEYTPFVFSLIFLAELNGAPTKFVHAAYASLFVFRVLHSLGMVCTKLKLGRAIGFVGTVLLMVGTGLYNFGLGYEPLLSFLGVN
ncbi:hypothetical protein MVES1_001615 [Malassezia vespertilionis]|uniref:Uncharacterized protein n=1 Tax=Malassezia vespertilionis TaxID=2020962 RepID=A0A2N1JCV8_9BASI|nr:uncharacterized protein MVES1_001615 [Malassezia vespertilionis]PKI84379.1 hypothetical protein MVES_001518 [Malassezia vespertilionis]WFD06270.1 hypothetical protein MVES1_001615 [Malassezia vespertilionis]